MPCRWPAGRTPGHHSAAGAGTAPLPHDHGSIGANTAPLPHDHPTCTQLTEGSQQVCVHQCGTHAIKPALQRSNPLQQKRLQPAHAGPMLPALCSSSATCQEAVMRGIQLTSCGVLPADLHLFFIVRGTVNIVWAGMRSCGAPAPACGGLDWHCRSGSDRLRRA